MEQSPPSETNGHVEIKKFHTIYGTRRFIVEFRRARNWYFFLSR